MMSSLHQRYQAWREAHREPAMQYRSLCQNHLPPERITEIDRMLKDAHAVELYCRWWSELKTVAIHEAQQVCSIDHQDVLERFNGYCTCCGLTMTDEIKAAITKNLSALHNWVIDATAFCETTIYDVYDANINKLKSRFKTDQGFTRKESMSREDVA